ncbi:MAG: small multi-drug export protein, partial [Treponema sp.]|nr:small multi-drug export protein [Treponema sp.]
DLPLIPSYIICIIGNMIPVPIIFFFARKFLEWGKDKKVIGKICSFFLEKGAKAGRKLNGEGKKSKKNLKAENAESSEESGTSDVGAQVLDEESEKAPAKTGKGLFIALMLFVAIPLPGTGAWTGTLGASMLNMKFRDAVLAIILGVLIAGVIMMLGSLGVFSGIEALFQNK